MRHVSSTTKHAPLKLQLRSWTKSRASLHPLQHDREILIAAIRELTATAEENKTDIDLVVVLVAHATALSSKLFRIQTRIEELDID